MTLPCRLLLVLGLALSLSAREEHDVVIYGGTSAAIIAAVQVKKMGRSVIVASPDRHLGGLSSGGLGWTDTGNKAVIGGLSRDFYHRIWKHYDDDSAWKHEQREEFGGQGQGTPAVDKEARTMWIFEPSVAEKVFEGYVTEFDLEVVRDAWLDRGEGGVTRKDGRITAIRTLDGRTYRGKMFMDATYEGDLIAAAGVNYHVGREGKEVYGEEWNGVQTGVLHHRHHFDAIPDKTRISPYVVPDDPSSGLLPRISGEHPGEKHASDDKVQAYCFRMCLTNHPDNRVPFSEPEGYDPKQYELLARIYAAGWRETFGKFDLIPNRKTDTNNHGPFSTDNIGYNHDYPEASYERRREIIKEHETYQKGWLWFHCTDPRVPEEIREQMKTWGLPKDEFVDNGHWSHQLYIREARRMVGHFVMTEHEVLKRRPTPQSVGMGSYTLDSHNVQRYVTPEGYVQNEGDIGVRCRPYEIAYGSIIPKKEQCGNLFAPVCVSSSHIAFGSIRMEPVFMILGQSAATAAVQAIEDGVAVQDVDYAKLRQRLEADGQVLTYAGPIRGKGVDPKKLKGKVIDDSQAKLEGHWVPSTSHKTYLGVGYLHDGNRADGDAEAAFETDLKPGRYEVRLAYTPNLNRASMVPVTVQHAGGRTTISVNQKLTPPIDGLFLSLGTFEFEGKGAVSLSNEGTDGYVVADGAQWIPE